MAETKQKPPEIKRLTRKQTSYVANRISGMSQIDSAVAAGYARSGAAKHANTLEKLPVVIAAMDRHKEEIRLRGEYGYDRAMAEAQRAYDVAESTKNANAMVKAAELRSKLTGLLIEKQHIQVETLDITGALSDARARVELLREAKRNDEVKLLNEDPTTTKDELPACDVIIDLSTTKDE